jgi:hypothetical protein
MAVAKGCVAAAGIYCGVGLSVPIAPTIVALFAVVMVRVLVWTKNKGTGWNITVCALAMLAAFVSVEGSAMNVFRAFWLGVGYGAIGVGIIEMGKSAVLDNLRAALKGALGGDATK